MINKRIYWVFVALGLALILPWLIIGKNTPNLTLNKGKATGYQALFEPEKLKYYESLMAKPWAKEAKKQIEMLQKEEKALMSELFKLAGINEEVWQSGLSKNKEVILGLEKQVIDGTKPLDDGEPKEFLADFIQQFGFKKDQLKLLHIPSDDNNGPAMASNSCLFVQESLCNKSDKDAMKLEWLNGILSHEMQHILHDDCFIWTLIEATFDSFNVAEEKRQDFLSRFSKFREKRADIMGGLSDPLHAQGLANFIKSLVKVGDISMTTLNYPTPDQRIEYLTTMAKEMLAC